MIKVDQLQEPNRKRIHCTLSEKDIEILKKEADRLDVCESALYHSILHLKCLDLEKCKHVKQGVRKLQT